MVQVTVGYSFDILSYLNLLIGVGVPFRDDPRG